MSVSNVSIDGRRLLADLYRLREFGTYKTGVHRPTFSAVDMDSRRWLMERMREAGLEPEIDGIGNVIGRGSGEGPRLLLGSHTETQNHAGWLDGALGVMYGLEVARAVGHGIDVVAWADEEGHYGSFLGSRSYIGDLSEAEIDAGRNRYDGSTLRDALAAAGLAGRPRLAHRPGRYRGYMEAHIEQGDDLEAHGLKIGVVTSIVGIWSYRITFEGVQNHAGTTRMAIRRDAGVALRVARQSVGAGIADADQARLLREPVGAPLLRMTRTAFDDTGSAVEYGSHVYRGSRYSFEVTLVER